LVDNCSGGNFKVLCNYSATTQRKGGKLHRKIFKTGNSLAVSLPKVAVEQLGLKEGAVVNVYLDSETRKLTIEPVVPGQTVKDIDDEFAQQVSEFIEENRPALDDLAK
jgi:antitoxin component of MazEF toxin-antitoxin module